MPKRIQLPDGNIGEFPDSMSNTDIEAVLQKQYPPARADNSQPTQFERERMSDVALVPVQRAVAKAAGKPAPDLSNLEPTVEGKLVPKGTTMKALPVAAANNLIYPGTGTAASGVGDVAKGNVARGAHKILSGGFEALSTGTPLALEAAPALVARAMAGGYLGSKAGSKVAETLGASQDVQDLSGDIGGAAGGGLALKGGKLVPHVGDGAAKLASTAATIVSPDVVGIVSPRLAHVQRVLGKFAEAYKSGKPVDMKDVGPIPDEAAFPVTTPSDVPLEQMPSESVAYPKLTDPAIIGAKPRIRASAEAARGKQTFTENRNDQSFLDYARNDLERHGRNADLEASREFAANNSMDTPKWQRVAESKAADVLQKAQQQVQQIMDEAQKAATTPKRYTETPGLKPATPQDLAALLEKSIAAAKARKAQGK